MIDYMKYYLSSRDITHCPHIHLFISKANLLSKNEKPEKLTTSTLLTQYNLSDNIYNSFITTVTSRGPRKFFHYPTLFIVSETI